MRSAFPTIAFVVSLTTTAWAQSGSDGPPAQPEPGERGRTRLQLGVSLKSNTTPGTDTNRRLNEDAFIMKAGIAYGIF